MYICMHVQLYVYAYAHMYMSIYEFANALVKISTIVFTSIIIDSRVVDDADCRAISVDTLFSEQTFSFHSWTRRLDRFSASSKFFAHYTAYFYR